MAPGTQPHHSTVVKQVQWPCAQQESKKFPLPRKAKTNGTQQVNWFQQAFGKWKISPATTAGNEEKGGLQVTKKVVQDLRKPCAGRAESSSSVVEKEGAWVNLCVEELSSSHDGSVMISFTLAAKRLI